MATSLIFADPSREQALAFWIDGGWGVDALLGEQTRPHSDLDLAVKLYDLPPFRLSAFPACLECPGLSPRSPAGDAHWNWVLQQASGRSIDLHGFILDPQGNGVLGDPAKGGMYPAGALNGIGALGGLKLRCVAVPCVLNLRNGFEPRPIDHHDVAALCTRFGLARPSRFQLSPGDGIALDGAA